MAGGGSCGNLGGRARSLDQKQRQSLRQRNDMITSTLKKKKDNLSTWTNRGKGNPSATSVLNQEVIASVQTVHEGCLEYNVCGGISG